jgi:hypothetical protein
MQKYAAQLLGQTFGDVGPDGTFVPGLISQGYQPYMVPKRDAQGNIIKGADGKPQLVPGQRVAEFSPDQEAAFQRYRRMGISPEIGQAADIARQADAAAKGVNYDAYGNATNFYGDKDYQMGAPERVSGPTGMERVGAERFGLGAMQDYMSPYMQGVVERQKQAAVQDYARQIPGLQAQGIRAGARGGSREALVQAEAQRNLMNQLGDIQSQGSQRAYEQAMGQFNADAARQQQAQQLNQAMAGQYGQMGLNAALANQQAGLTSGQANLQAMLQGAANRAQYGLAGANLREQSRQFGAGLGLQGIQQRLAAAGALGGLGMQGYQQGMGINQALLGAGGQQQALNQQLLNQQYQDFINQQQFPYKQAEFGMGILRGLPATGQTSTFYQQPGNLFGQIAGTAVGVGSLFNQAG